MTTHGPTSTPDSPPPSSRPTNLTGARLLLQQRCLGTLAHELGNITSPIALIADVLDRGATQHAPAAAATLRLAAASLTRTTMICRLLRGGAAAGTLAPALIADTASWWALCAPYATDMLPAQARVDATISPVMLQPAQYEALIWATIAICALASATRPALGQVSIIGTAEANETFVLRITIDAPRTVVATDATRQLRHLASEEIRNAGGRVRTQATATMLDWRCALPIPRTADGS